MPADRGVTLIITTGNMLRGDDAVGPLISERLQTKRPELKHREIIVIDAGDHPEDIYEKGRAYRAAKVIIIDAADFGGQGGQVRVIPEEAIDSRTLSTHRFPLSVAARLLTRETAAEVCFVGIQPVTVRLGASLSAAVLTAAEDIAGFIDGCSNSHRV